MIGLVADDTLHLKADELSARAFTGAGCVPVTYTRNGVTMTMSYASAPIEGLEDPETAKTWAARAHAAGAAVGEQGRDEEGLSGPAAR